MISDVAQCGPWMLVPAGLGAVGGLLMGWASVRGRPWNVEACVFLTGASCIFLGFMFFAYASIERCYGLPGIVLFWLVVIAGLILMLATFFFWKKKG